MSRIAHSFLLGILLLIPWPSLAQRSGSPASSQPPSASGPSVGPSPNIGAPRYVDGRIVQDTGQPVPAPVSVGLNCGPISTQVIRTDVKGYFRFNLEAGPQSNMNLSAADDAPAVAAANGMNSPAVFGSVGDFSRGLIGCELRVSAPGYQPLTKGLGDPYADSLGIIDVGTLQLKRTGEMQTPVISLSSLQIPSAARKEFDKGVAEAHSKHLNSATQHLRNAVAKYDKYAAAWNELGKVYFDDHETDKARQAFAKAITADPQYIAPYMSLASLAIQNQEYESAVENTEKALEIDPALSAASFLQAVGNFNLNRLDAAEKNAHEAERGSQQSIPQLHALLADILLQKQDYSNAAIEMRTYLNESPGGAFAGDMQKKLIEEALLYSSKKHFIAASFWSGFHLILGIPMVLMSAIAGASALAQFDKNHLIAGVLSIAIVALSSVMTFLNPNAKAAAHQNAGNKYDSFMNKTRIFWSIDCWRDESEQVLTEKLKYISEQKDNLNQTCPQPPTWSYWIAKRGIEAGQGEYKVDVGKR